MAIDITPILRPSFLRRAKRTDLWSAHTDTIQITVLKEYLKTAAGTQQGRKYDYTSLAKMSDPRNAFAQSVPTVAFEDIRGDVMKMVSGEKDILWPGLCRHFAQSSGTSGGKSKYIPITQASLQANHFAGAHDVVAHYLRMVPNSKIFSGKAFILGGSFANELQLTDKNVCVGDLSATLISKTPRLYETFRVPSRRIALMSDWEKKLPALAQAAAKANVTNLSGVPSWFLGVLKKILEISGANSIHEVWPNMETFFHGGISFAPYRQEYQRIIDPGKMHYVETYNASEGFFASQNDFADPAMLLIVDSGIYYEFIPVTTPDAAPVGCNDIEKGKVYELVITAFNGLCRYRLGDTVKVESTAPLKITIAGRTRSFINAFGEELMENNAEQAIAETCRKTGASIRNYTVAPVYAAKGKRGRHEWLIEWAVRPESIQKFAETLDNELRNVNSDYDAKRAHTIFLDPLTIVTARPGLFDDWLKQAGTHKLGGQRKVPRLSNDRSTIDDMLPLNDGR